MDIFFVLSGFLIGFVLFKEYKRYADIDVGHFLTSRFWRIWPVLMAVCIWMLKDDWVNWDLMQMIIPCSMFLGNFFGQPVHLWSVNVEF